MADKPTPQELDRMIEEKASMLQAGEEMLKDLHRQIDNLQQECNRLACIRDQQANEVSARLQHEETFRAVAYMLRNHYGPEIKSGRHANLQSKHIVCRYMNRERNLMLRTNWRYRLARWLVKGSIDQQAPRPQFELVANTGESYDE